MMKKAKVKETDMQEQQPCLATAGQTFSRTIKVSNCVFDLLHFYLHSKLSHCFLDFLKIIHYNLE